MQKKTSELMKSALNPTTSKCVSGDCAYAKSGCPCEGINKRVYHPVIKERAIARIKAARAKKKIHHEVKNEEKTEKVLCSFPVKSCDHCVLEMGAMWRCPARSDPFSSGSVGLVPGD